MTGRRSPPAPRRRSRDRPPAAAAAAAATHSNTGSSRAEEQARMREMLLREAAQRNPDAASVLAGRTSASSAAYEQDGSTLQRALSTANALGQQQRYHQQQPPPPPYSNNNNNAYPPPLQYGNQHGGGYRPPPPPQRGGGGGGGFASSSSSSSSRPVHIPNHEKLFLELHISGLSDSVTHDEGALTRFLNQTCAHKQLNVQPGNPVVTTRINRAGKFAFAMFRSREEATRGLELAGSEYSGCVLRVERPRGFKQLETSAVAPAQPAMDEAQLVAAVLANTPVPSLPGYTREQLRVALEGSLARLGGESTSLVELSNFEDGEDRVTAEDVEQEARRYGQVMGVRQVAAGGGGAFLVRMASLPDAERLVQLRRSCNDRRIAARFRPLADWQPYHHQ